MRFQSSLTVLACCAIALSGCYSKERLTSKATPCNIAQAKIVPSEFSRKGIETAWCALCKDILYQCNTNADRSRVQCTPASNEGPCR